MSLLEKSLLTPSHKVTYSYLFSSPSSPHNPTLLFLHGFPESRYCWRKQLPHFVKLGYGIIAPDLLGYGTTDHPENPEEYRYKRQVESLWDILNHEGVDKFVVIGHDWGTLPTSRIINYSPDRILAAVFIASTYAPPKLMMNLAEANAHSKKIGGYERRGYFSFMTQEGAGDLIRKHIDSWLSLFFAEDPSLWATDFCPTGAMGAWIEADRKVPFAPWFGDEEYAFYKESVTSGIDAQLNWYQVSLHNLSFTFHKVLPKDAEYVKSPVLMLPCLKDCAAMHQIAKELGKKYCLDLEIVDLNSSHWATSEVPDEVNVNIETFLKKRLGEPK